MKIKRQDTSIPVFSYVMDIFLNDYPHVVRLYVLDLKSVL